MSAFTDTTTKDLQSLTLYNELQLAYSERRQAIGSSSAAAYSEDDYLQKLSMWTVWQAWIEANCTSFLNYNESGPICDNTTGLEYFTEATFRTKAGLNASGFRREPESGTEYGTAQADDYVGPWLIDELQDAFSVLRYTVINASTTAATESKGGNGDDEAGSWSAAYAAAKGVAAAAYAADTPSTGSLIWASSGACANGHNGDYTVLSTFAYLSTGLWQFDNTINSAIGAMITTAGLVLKGKIATGVAATYVEQTYDSGAHNVDEGWSIKQIVSPTSLGSDNYQVLSSEHDHDVIDWPTAVPTWVEGADATQVIRGYYIDTGDRKWILYWAFTNA